MTIHKIRLGTNEDGTPLFHYYQDDPTKAVVITGPISGTVELPGGKTVDVTDPIVEVEDEAEALAVSDAIGQRHQDEGHPLFVADPNTPNDGFVAVPSTEA